jgi:hypothetical protein
MRDNKYYEVTTLYRITRYNIYGYESGMTKEKRQFKAKPKL